MRQSRATRSPRRSANAISPNKPLIIGHRGASALAPENTCAAFARALDDGADGIELDVRLAKGGVPVVIHDATLRRTGLMTGDVERMTSEELAAIDVGNWFQRVHPQWAHEHDKRQCVPTLADVFALLRDRPAVLYIELKTDGAGSTYDLVQSVTEKIVESNFQKRVVVVSFDHAALAKAKSLNPSIRTGALFEPRRPSLTWRADIILDIASDCGADEILPHRLLARSRLIQKAHARHLPVVVWTVDDPSWLRRAKTLGIHALITNNPARMLAASSSKSHRR